MNASTSRIWIDAPREVVWAVLTDPAHVKAWQYGSDLQTDWLPGSSIRFVVEWEGGSFEQWGSVVSFEPPAQLSYTLFAPRPDLEDLPENYFTMTYVLAEAAGGTELSIVQHDPRPRADAGESSDGADESGDDAENPILLALRQHAEALARTS